MKTTTFFLESIKNMKTVGAVAACSPRAVRKMTKPVNFSQATLIVELGGGTGVVTKEILARMRVDARLIVFEINPVFAEMLSQLADERLTVVNESALQLGTYLASHGIMHADAVVSTLPLSIMDRETRAGILDAVQAVLEPDGRYVQIQYSLVSKREIENKFTSVSLDFTPFNFPPAFVYICAQRALS